MNLALFSASSSITTVNDGAPAQDQHISEPKLSDDLPLTDKVYNFTAPNDRLPFNNYFSEHYIYNIHIALVTPHSCTMNITLLDHDGKLFNIFDAVMSYNLPYRYYDIPFGVATRDDENDVHTLIFETDSSLNFNLHILIEKEVKCLYDKMDPMHIENLEFYDVKRYSNGEEDSFPVGLETDEMYKCYIGRVSPITELYSPFVRVDYTITCPDGLLYIIYSDTIIAGVATVSTFDFGTATEGTYTVHITVNIDDPRVGWVNIAYAIADDYTIGEAEHMNTTKSDVRDSKSDDTDALDELANNILVLPSQMLIGTLLGIGGIAAITIVMLIRNQKKNVVSATLKTK